MRWWFLVVLGSLVGRLLLVGRRTRRVSHLSDQRHRQGVREYGDKVDGRPKHETATVNLPWQVTVQPVTYVYAIRVAFEATEAQNVTCEIREGGPGGQTLFVVPITPVTQTACQYHARRPPSGEAP